MLLLGKNIIQKNDPLTEISVEILFKALKNGNGVVAGLIQKLQILRSIDVGQYRKMKTTLPYIVCAHFQPAVRRNENFIGTSRFLADIDHLSECDLNLEDLKAKLISDPRVELLFSSPGGDGIKVLFKLKHKITDSGYYTVFYKVFCMQFAQQYQLGAALDIKTSDVARCCFVSYDATAFYNPVCEAVNASDYLDENSLNALDEANAKIGAAEKINKQERKEISEEQTTSRRELSQDILNEIKQKIGQKIRTTKEKIYEQPEELKAVMAEMINELVSTGLEITRDIPIAYGRQVTLKAGKLWAEINIFHGKKGVKIVGTTKTGSDKDLCEMTVNLLRTNFE